MNIDEAIQHCEEKAKELREQAGFDTDNERYRMSESEKADCIECANEHEQLAEWLKELKGLRLLTEWMVQCDFGYDNIPEEYEKYKEDIKGMNYTEGLIHIAKQEANKKGEQE